MIEKPKRKKQLNNQDRQIPANIQELINRYDLDNKDIYNYLDEMVTEIINSNSSFTDEINNLNNQIIELNKQLEKVEETQIKNLEINHPIGSTYITQDNTNPAEILKFGTWERLKGKVCLGIDEDDADFDTIGNTGGEKEHVLTVDEMPSHTHSYMTTSIGNPVEDFDNGMGVIRGKSSYDLSKNINSSGGNKPHNNMSPYEVVGYMWIRRG